MDLEISRSERAFVMDVNLLIFRLGTKGISFFHQFYLFDAKAGVGFHKGRWRDNNSECSPAFSMQCNDKTNL